VDGHENPLAGFNLIANFGFWSSLHESEQAAIHAAARRHVARQREHTRTPGSAFYARVRERCGTNAWKLLQDGVGRLD